MKKKQVSKRKLEASLRNYAKNYQSKYKGLGDKERRATAVELFKDIRGKYVLGQACAIAYKELRKTEPSNADDIALLGELVGGFFYAMSLGKLGLSDGRNGASS